MKPRILDRTQRRENATEAEIVWLMDEPEKHANSGTKVMGAGWQVRYEKVAYSKVYTLRLYELGKRRSDGACLFRKIGDIAYATVKSRWPRKAERALLAEAVRALARTLGTAYNWAFYERARHYGRCPDMVAILQEFEEVHERCQSTSSRTS